MRPTKPTPLHSIQACSQVLSTLFISAFSFSIHSFYFFLFSMICSLIVILSPVAPLRHHLDLRVLGNYTSSSTTTTTTTATLEDSIFFSTWNGSTMTGSKAKTTSQTSSWLDLTSSSTHRFFSVFRPDQNPIFDLTGSTDRSDPILQTIVPLHLSLCFAVDAHFDIIPYNFNKGASRISYKYNHILSLESDEN